MGKSCPEAESCWRGFSDQRESERNSVAQREELNARLLQQRMQLAPGPLYSLAIHWKWFSLERGLILSKTTPSVKARGTVLTAYCRQ